MLIPFNNKLAIRLSKRLNGFNGLSIYTSNFATAA